MVGWLVGGCWFLMEKNKEEEKTFVLILLFLKHLLNVRVRMYLHVTQHPYTFYTNIYNKQQQQNAISF